MLSGVMIWYSIVSCGVVWYGMVWYIWYGVVCVE